ncbi:MAG: galactose mutarotase, partial [Oscillospiraceae bacterium]|nr:galactose mutarotase [Oscillospiraceae bacterium]
MAVEFYPFGRLSDGRQVTAAKLKNRAGASVTVLDYGATIQSLCVPARDGSLVDVVLGYDTAEEYERNGDFFGATIGRVANRIGGAAFELHGKRYELAKNDGENHLHGGTEGFDRKLWRMAAQGESLLCWRISPDGEENYPGNLKVQVLFTLTEDNRLCIGYDADTDADTLLNLTNHSYFNLNGSGDILSHRLQLSSERFCENNAVCLPTGRLLWVEGTAFDFRREKEIGADISAEEEQLKLAGG